DTLVGRGRAILSATVRDANGKMIVEAGDQFAEWGSQIEDRGLVSREGKREDCSIEERGTVSFSPRNLQSEIVRVPIALGDNLWGTVELRFQQRTATGIRAWLANPLVRLGSFVAVAGFAAYLVYVQRTLGNLHAERLQ